MALVDDPYARGMLGPAVAVVYRVARRWPNRIPSLPVTLAGLAGRVLWHDGEVRRAVESGIDQVVVVGAGFDSRAWRLGLDGVVVVEVDHPATQAVKRSRAPSPGPVYVGADLRSTSAVDALRSAGLDLTRPTAYVLEGLTMYLSESDLRGHLTDLAAGSAASSRLTTDFYPPRDTGSSAHRRQDRAQALARSGSGEGLGALLVRERAVDLVADCGWSVDAVSGAQEAARALLPDRCGLPLGAVNDGKTLLAASAR
jgi:methyltransferase (TIGR00027 family)